MREILFRGKRIDNGRWICGGYFAADSRHFICDGDDTAQVDPETVGQFTGLVDWYGVKIFEGDTVKTTWFGSNNTSLVVYDEGCFYECGPEGKKSPLYLVVDEESGRAEGVEVIGNAP